MSDNELLNDCYMAQGPSWNAEHVSATQNIQNFNKHKFIAVFQTSTIGSCPEPV